MDAKCAELQEKICYKFKNVKLLREALTLPDALNEDHTLQESNRKLAFIGDTGLKYVVSQLLLKSFKSDREQQSITAEQLHILTDDCIRNNTILSDVGKRLDLADKFIRGNTKKEVTPMMLATGVEAILGAIVMDNETDKQQPLFDVVKRFWAHSLNGPAMLTKLMQDPKKFRQKETIKSYKDEEKSDMTIKSQTSYSEGNQTCRGISLASICCSVMSLLKQIFILFLFVIFVLKIMENLPHYEPSRLNLKRG